MNNRTFLSGETLYLRGIEISDAKRASAWRGSPFPMPAEPAEDWLKKTIPEEHRGNTYRLVACRLADDEPVGGAVYHVDGWRLASVSFTADPAFGPAAMAIKAEMLRLVVPWLVGEREMMAVWADLDGGEPPVLAAAEAVGMRPAYRLREAIWRDGARHDQLTYEVLNPHWVARLGEPEPAILDAPPPQVTRRPFASPTGDPPRNAVVAGERVYLRPVETADAEQAARWSGQETETFFDQGRHIRNPISTAHWFRKIAEDDPPSMIFFAIVLRDGDELIGSNGLADISWLHRTAETISDIYRPQHRGGGLGTEAKHLLLEYAFERLGLHMVRSYVWAPNTRSAAALRKQGYRDAGRLHWGEPRQGVFADGLVFDLLAAEWRTQR